jgi:hypothetical protein
MPNMPAPKEKYSVYFKPPLEADSEPMGLHSLEGYYFIYPYDFESRDDERTPLLRASEKGNEKIVHLLLKNGAC